jgi:WASH complex subunit 7
MSREIKRLGNTKQGISFLDKFRQLITQIGNALGYVRMIRSAALKDNSNLVKYIPDIVNKIKFEDMAEELGISGETFEAVKILDMCIRNLFKQKEDAGDYLRMIVRSFDGLFEAESTKHLKLFYLIIPTLTLSYIDHVQSGKEKLFSKKENVGGFISDDGFALGVAYLLKILDQVDKFASLNWFESMAKKLEMDLA